MNDIKQLRMNIMGGMHAYVLELGDEVLIDYWYRNGLPDNLYEEMLVEYAEDDELWLGVVHAFASVLRMD